MVSFEEFGGSVGLRVRLVSESDCKEDESRQANFFYTFTREGGDKRMSKRHGTTRHGRDHAQVTEEDQGE